MDRPRVFRLGPPPCTCFLFPVPGPVALGVIDKRHQNLPSPSSPSRMHVVSMDRSRVTSYCLIVLRMNFKGLSSSSDPHLHHQTGFAGAPPPDVVAPSSSSRFYRFKLFARPIAAAKRVRAATHLQLRGSRQSTSRRGMTCAELPDTRGRR